MLKKLNYCIALLFLLLTFTNVQAVFNGFLPPVPYATDDTPFAIATADFNGDFIPDIAVVNQSSNNVGIYFGQGDGTFVFSANYSVGSTPYQILVGDFNGFFNGPDIAVTNSADNTVSILLNNGDGTFQAQTTYSVGNQPIGITSGFFNIDPFVDLAICNIQDNTVSILLGNGDGTFQPQTAVAAGAGPFGIQNGGFNGDLFTDLAVTLVTGNEVAILFGNGDGTFQAPTTFPAGTAPEGIVVTDFNGDTNLDIAVVNATSNTVSVLLGDGNGSFAPRTPYGVQGLPAFLVTGIFNTGGSFDIVTANLLTGNVSVLINKGDGTFFQQHTYAAGPVAYGIVVGDFNQDGLLDVAVTNRDDNQFSILLQGPPPVTNTVLSSFPNPSFLGQEVSFTAIVTGQGLNGTPNGNVTFFDNNNPIATVNLNGQGIANFTTSALTIGTHTIRAEYNGNAFHEPSTSNELLQYAIVFPPTDLAGTQDKVKFLVQSILVNELDWQPNETAPEPALYRIYRDNLANLIATVSGSKTIYYDSNIKKNRSYTYFVEAVDNFGNTSAPVSIVINPS